MANILDRIHHLLALAASSSENEARNAAFLAAELIRKHGVLLTLPPNKPDAAASSGEKSTASQKSAAASRRRTPSSKRVKRVADPAEKILSPLGGECIHCGERYRPQQTVYWFASGGGMHVRCFEAWAKAR